LSVEDWKIQENRLILGMLLAGGGTAVVYEGIDLTTHSRVALKVMSTKEGRATVPIKAVKREIEYAVSVQNDHIVKLLDFVVDEKNILIVWELIDGSDLLDLLNDKGGRFDERTAASYFAQLLQAVMFIHSNGLCHRDLKPENCMIEKSTNRLKIIDFGLSKREQSAVTLGVGTPDYMAPELLGETGGNFDVLRERKIGKYDAKACDVWAMGVLLYLIVTGKYPFEDPKEPKNVVRTLQNISAGRRRPLPARISAACGDIIAAMLASDPKKRITLQQMCVHPWFKQCGVNTSPKAAQNSTVDQMEAEKDVPVQPQNDGEEFGRLQSFTFPDADESIQHKETPHVQQISHSVIEITAETVRQGNGSPSPNVSPPPKITTASRTESLDKIVQITKVQPVEEDSGKRKGFGGFCRLIFGRA